MKIRISRPSPAMLVAILALVVAMSGSAYAIQRVQSGDSLVAKRTLSGNRLRLNTVTGKEVPDLHWHKLVLLFGWTSVNDFNGRRPPAWAKDVQGVVHLRGAIHQQTADPNLAFARLPLAARPNAALYLATTMGNAKPGRLNVQSNGYIGADGDVQTDAESYTALDGVTYTLH